MKIDMDIYSSRGDFRLTCKASYGEGIHLISGPVGSGKTTLALSMTGLTAYEGDVHKEGINSVVLSMQFPEHHVTSSTVEGEISSWGLEPTEILRRTRLEEKGKTDPFRLSRGQLKRLILSCAIAKEPDLLILDEPFSSLDCRSKDILCRAIEKREGKITFVFSHERAVLPRADTLSHIEDGVLSQYGKVPDSIPAWKGAPPYLRRALDMGAEPDNIRIQDVQEAMCAMHGSGY